MVVDLPEPFGPRYPVTLPTVAEKLTSSTATMPRNLFDTRRSSSILSTYVACYLYCFLSSRMLYSYRGGRNKGFAYGGDDPASRLTLRPGAGAVRVAPGMEIGTLVCTEEQRAGAPLLPGRISGCAMDAAQLSEGKTSMLAISSALCLLALVRRCCDFIFELLSSRPARNTSIRNSSPELAVARYRTPAVAGSHIDFARRVSAFAQQCNLSAALDFPGLKGRACFAGRLLWDGGCGANTLCRSAANYVSQLWSDRRLHLRAALDHQGSAAPLPGLSSAVKASRANRPVFAVSVGLAWHRTHVRARARLPLRSRNANRLFHRATVALSGFLVEKPFPMSNP